MNFFRLFDLDRISFWFGFLTATLFWRLYGIIRPVIREAWQRGRENAGQWGRRWQAGTEVRLRQDTLRFAQGRHLAAGFAPLDDLLVPPRLLGAPMYIAPDETVLLNGVRQIVPHLPEWPEVETIYNAPSLSLAEALQGGANIVVIGHPGYGKSVTLADLASRMARQDDNLGVLTGRIPLFVDAGDLDLSTTSAKPLEILLSGLTKYTSSLTKTRLPQVVRTQLGDDNALLLVDSLDVCSPEELQKIVDFLRRLLHDYPRLQIVTTASLDSYDGLTGLGFAPLAIRSWGNAEQQRFLEKWLAVWSRLPESARATQPAPAEILTGWLHTHETFFSPLEYGLMLWALFAGDALGNTPADAIEAHVRRTSPADQRAALGALAWEIVQSGASPVIAAQPTPEENESPVDESTSATESTPAAESAPADTPGAGTQPKSPLLTHQRGQTRFIHPVFCAWLAAEYAASQGLEGQLFALPDSPLRNLTEQYLAAHADIGSHVQTLLIDIDDDPLYRNLLRVARWLPLAQPQAAWRGTVMRQLVRIIQSSNHALALRSRCVAGMALSNDPGASIMLRRLMVESPTAELRYLGVLGSGLLQDPKSYPVIETLIKDNDLRVQRMACLALSTQKHHKALEGVVQALVSGNEPLRQIAAEVLAAHPGEGHDVLRDGSTYEDLLVRRAVVFGLLQVPETWARETLARMQLEDGEWVVRAAAEQALAQYGLANRYIPKPLPPLHNIPWLLEAAAKQGRGIASAEHALETLAHILRNGDTEERLQALHLVRLLPNAGEGLVAATYALLYGDDPDLQTAAFDTLRALSAQGVPLPPPRQFGMA
ncbi:MAG: hypothetical protein Fur0018_12410 [Anaerolineales bacterium]